MHKDHNHKFEECLQSMPISLNCYVYNISVCQSVCVMREESFLASSSGPLATWQRYWPFHLPPAVFLFVCVLWIQRDGNKRPTWAQSAALHVPGDSLGPPENLTPLGLGSQAQVRFIKTGLQRQQVALFSPPITPLFALWHPVCFGRVPSPAGQEPGGVCMCVGWSFHRHRLSKRPRTEPETISSR